MQMILLDVVCTGLRAEACSCSVDVILKVVAGLFLAVLFLQSGLDKMFIWKSELEWLKKHFERSPLKAVTALLLAVIMVMEIAAGLLCAAGIIVLPAAGNGLWLAGHPVSHVTLWWAGFLVLTIAGERLELARLLLLNKRALLLFAVGVVLYLIGLLVSLLTFEPGVRWSGLGLLALGLWLLRYDLARKTIRQTGLPRFVAACLLPGYAWLIFAGALWLWRAEVFAGGPLYDAMLHSLLLGFVFSMIFGHAPIILPAVIGLPLAYRPAFYAHLALLHAGLAARVAGDLAFNPALRMWGGLFNVIAILLFLGNMVRSARWRPSTRRAPQR